MTQISQINKIMIKTTVLLAIIAICLISFSSFAQFPVTAHCEGNYSISNSNPMPGDKYDVLVRVISLWPTNTYTIIFYQVDYSTAGGPHTLGGIGVNGVEYVYPSSVDYYTMRISARLNGGAWRSSDSYAGFTIVGGIYYLTADNDFAIYF